MISVGWRESSIAQILSREGWLREGLAILSSSHSRCLFSSLCLHSDRDFRCPSCSGFEEAHSDRRQKRADESRKPSDRIKNLRRYTKPCSLTGDNEGKLSPREHCYSNLGSFTFRPGQLSSSPCLPFF